MTELGGWESQFWAIMANSRISLEELQLSYLNVDIITLFKDTEKKKGEKWGEKYHQVMPQFAVKHPAWFFCGKFEANEGGICVKKTIISLLETGMADTCYFSHMEDDCSSFQLFKEQRMLHGFDINITTLCQLCEGSVTSLSLSLSLHVAHGTGV